MINSHETSSYEIVFPSENDGALLIMASTLINQFAEQGIMLAVTADQLAKIASQGMLALAMDEHRQLIGTAAVTFEYPDGTLEFGGWAVSPNTQAKGVGKGLLQAILSRTNGKRLVAFGNSNSAPIFEKYGATEIDQRQMHPDAFVMCQTCGCKHKEDLPEGKSCVDTIYDLKPAKVK